LDTSSYKNKNNFSYTALGNKEKLRKIKYTL